jgi:uncharacterized membrane protein
MTRYFKYLIWPIALVPLVYLFSIWDGLPEEMAMHFDLKGNPDRYGNKSELLVMTAVLSAMSILIYFVLSNIYKIDPKKYAADNKDRLHRMGFAVAVFIIALTCFIIYSTSKGNMRMSMRYIFAGVGLLLCLIGNYMHTIKPNYFAGLRLPWTLNNEDNWRKTHLLAGKLWFIGGLATAILCLLVPDTVAIILFFIATVVLILVPVIYSYRLYKKNNQAESL